MNNKEYRGLVEAYNSIYEVTTAPDPKLADKKPVNPQSAETARSLFANPPAASPAPTASTPAPAARPVAAAPSRNPLLDRMRAMDNKPEDLEALRKASAQATMAGPSKEAQALMAQTAKGRRALQLMGPEKLKAGIEGQERVEKMKSEMGAKKPEAPTPPAAPRLPAPTTSTQTPTRQPEAPKPPVPDRSKEYQMAWDNRNNPFAKGRIKDAWSKMTPEERKAAKEWATKNNKDWKEMNLPESSGLADAYTKVYEQIRTDNPDKTLQKIIDSDPKYGGGKVIPSTPTKSANVQKAHYEPDGKIIESISIYDEVLELFIAEGYTEEESKKIMVENILNIAKNLKDIKTAAQMFKYMTGIEKLPIKPPSGPVNLTKLTLKGPSPTVAPKPKFQWGTPPKTPAKPSVKPKPTVSPVAQKAAVAGATTAAATQIGNTSKPAKPGLTDAQFDKKYKVNEPPGDEFAAARKNTQVAPPAPKLPPPAAPAVTAAPKPKSQVKPEEKPETPKFGPIPPLPPLEKKPSLKDTLDDLRAMTKRSQERQKSMSEGVRPGEVEKPLDKPAFKKRRRSLAGREASADARSRGHVDKFTGKPYSTAEAESRRRDIHKPEKAPEREARRRASEDPD
jgi:hypothetical protein